MVKDVASHFHNLSNRWEALDLPLRPRAPVPDLLKALIPQGAKRMLILGVTPDFAELAPDITALDTSEIMIAQVWPGDNDSRRAVLGDWRAMPFEDEAFDIVVGDGALTLLSFPNGVDDVLAEVRRVTRKDGVAIVRTFIAPNAELSDTEMKAYINSLKGHSIDALRWRFAVQAVHAAPTPNIVSHDAWQAFNRLYPDPSELMAQNGWTAQDLQRVELYRDGAMALNFPTKRQLEQVILNHFSHLAFEPSGDYPMSDLCPFAVMRN